jgi:hypothetical protein
LPAKNFKILVFCNHSHFFGTGVSFWVPPIVRMRFEYKLLLIGALFALASAKKFVATEEDVDKKVR